MSIGDPGAACARYMLLPAPQDAHEERGLRGAGIVGKKKFTCNPGFARRHYPRHNRRPRRYGMTGKSRERVIRRPKNKDDAPPPGPARGDPLASAIRDVYAETVPGYIGRSRRDHIRTRHASHSGVSEGQIQSRVCIVWCGPPAHHQVAIMYLVGIVQGKRVVL